MKGYSHYRHFGYLGNNGISQDTYNNTLFVILKQDFNIDANVIGTYRVTHLEQWQFEK